MLVLGGCIHNEGYLKGVALQPQPALGPEIAPATASAIWAPKRREIVLPDLNYMKTFSFPGKLKEIKTEIKAANY